jgi:hypothetical protein
MLHSCQKAHPQIATQFRGTFSHGFVAPASRRQYCDFQDGAKSAGETPALPKLNDSIEACSPPKRSGQTACPNSDLLDTSFGKKDVS